MVIDFHTHTFPDKIAAHTIELLSRQGNIRAYREGTLSSLKESMRKAGIDYSVVLPVATSVRQVDSINRYNQELNGKEGIFFAGAVHPDCENIEETLDGIKRAGFFGIKIHPDYQGVYFDDPRYIKVMKAAAERELITVTHAGFDDVHPEDVKCTPDRILHVLEILKGSIDNKLVLAHLGGNRACDEVMQKLVGKPVYMDTAVVLKEYPAERVKQIIKAHGCDKILFATDSPWGDQKEYLDIFYSLGFSETEKEIMLHKNARKLLNIEL